MELKSILGHDTHEIELQYYGDRDRPDSVIVRCMTCNMDIVELNDAGEGDVAVGPVKDFVQEKPKDPAIVLEGNFTDGFVAHGPFDTFDDAADYANTLLGSGPSWVMHLE